jgi:hypothetical protein
MKLHHDFQVARNERTWPSQARVREAAGQLGKQHPGNRTIYGKTVGLLVSGDLDHCYLGRNEVANDIILTELGVRSYRSRNR